MYDVLGEVYDVLCVFLGCGDARFSPKLVWLLKSVFHMQYAYWLENTSCLFTKECHPKGRPSYWEKAAGTGELIFTYPMHSNCASLDGINFKIIPSTGQGVENKLLDEIVLQAEWERFLNFLALEIILQWKWARPSGIEMQYRNPQILSTNGYCHLIMPCQSWLERGFGPTT